MAMRMRRSCSWPGLCACGGFVFAQLWAVSAASWWLLPLWTPLFDRSDSPLLCTAAPGLSPGQRSLCRRHSNHAEQVANGIQLALDECRHQLQAWRWNCTTPGAEDTLGPVAQSGSREAAFVSALIAAGVVHAVARACRQGALPGSCDCVAAAAADLPRGAQPGCGDDVKYGYRFARKFVDESEHDRRRHGRGGESRLELVQMNLHNNKAGRLAVYNLAYTQCKCHGLTGACTLKICWPQLADFRKVGNFLKDKYDASSAVRLVTHNWIARSGGGGGGGAFAVTGGRKSGKAARWPRLHLEPVDEGFVAPTASELVHVHGSPDYCERDDARGVAGTVGRRCHLPANGTGDCSIMCCDRGYNTVRVTVEKRCRCKFRWCCSVKCERCPQTVDQLSCK
ncbi:protein Wnt-5b-like [Lethenteron reissneri]|uniref:protein Wnt-5b-like n=1 Tax=Lethenteron reissneri TaxID=7753 RepID=UPI002AB7ADC0|nr:protein Wnt-5b-like [Lethenteron reissneri]